jgi:hypothetical protein
MYVYKRQVTMQRGIATLLAIALVLWVTGTHMFSSVEAANLTYVKNTLSDSDSGSASNHTIEFLSPTGVASTQTITITFPGSFNIATSGVGLLDYDFEIAGVDQTLVLGAPGAAEWQVSTSSQVVTLTAGAAESLPALATATVKIGTNATNGGTGTNRVTNPVGTTTSYEFTITAGPSDSGQTRVAITDNVLVTANVDTTLTFIVYGTTTGAVLNGSPTTTFGASTHNTLAFGTLANGVSKTLGQDLTLATNARNGYVVTVEQDANLLSSTGADIDGFIDGAYTNSPAAWIAPGNSIADENTWGHWGLTSNDPSLLGAGVDFTSDTWVAASTTPRAIMAHGGPADGTTLGIGRATIGYQAQITALQEAGDDYSTTLTYIATPTF